jgi:hypothetical protein
MVKLDEKNLEILGEALGRFAVIEALNASAEEAGDTDGLIGSIGTMVIGDQKFIEESYVSRDG